jgi:cell division septation protein DedD
VTAAARRRSLFGTLALLGILVVLGFTLGAISGLLWEEPRLLIAYLTGDTTEIAWDVEPDPGKGLGSPPAAPTPPAVAAPPPGPAATPPEALRELPDDPRPAAAGAGPGRFAIQVGAFGTSAAAERLADSLRGRGYPCYVTPGARSGDARWRVRVGPVAERQEADRLAARLKRDEKLPTWVLDEDGG